MYRVKKADGWNRYKVQKRFLWVFWVDVKCMNFFSEAEAMVCVYRLNGFKG